jgi:cytochrome b561
MTQSAGYPISFFGLFEFPVLLDKDKSLAEFFRSAHGIIWMILAGAVLGHVSAALHHHFIKKNGVLKKMLFGVRT